MTLTSTSFSLEIKKWPEITMVRMRKPDSLFDSKTFFVIKKRYNHIMAKGETVVYKQEVCN